MTIISNTTVVSNFASAGRFDLLHQLFDILYIPLGVHQEILAGVEEGYAFNTAITLALFPQNEDGWLRLVSLDSDAELADLSTLPRRIHRGEAECLVIARHRNWLFLTDDRRARTVAREWGVTLSGTLGCLVLAVERGHCSLTEGNELLSCMLDQGYRSTVKDLSDLS